MVTAKNLQRIYGGEPGVEPELRTVRNLWRESQGSDVPKSILVRVVRLYRESSNGTHVMIDARALVLQLGYYGDWIHATA